MVYKGPTQPPFTIVTALSVFLSIFRPLPSVPAVRLPVSAVLIPETCTVRCKCSEPVNPNYLPKAPLPASTLHLPNPPPLLFLLRHLSTNRRFLLRLVKKCAQVLRSLQIWGALFSRRQISGLHALVTWRTSLIPKTLATLRQFPKPLPLQKPPLVPRILAQIHLQAYRYVVPA